ncbi:hypothetical protein ElyMa_006862800 [Elysia marginata]|uniref:Zinc finger GRF-type domain-containing protein n=1 Tax=Elysia marginata TaxID=1093978 RepID=A0AAV4J889_9GAST|nr:hypothetical protein ElyMa_006862800 [Elysia marginata]
MGVTGSNFPFCKRRLVLLPHVPGTRRARIDQSASGKFRYESSDQSNPEPGSWFCGRCASHSYHNWRAPAERQEGGRGYMSRGDTTQKAFFFRIAAAQMKQAELKALPAVGFYRSLLPAGLNRTNH